MDNNEKRNSERMKTLWTVFDISHDSPKVIGYIKDVNKNGLRIATNKTYKPKQFIQLKIRIPEQSKINTIFLGGIIRHVTNLITPKPYENEIGVEITEENRKDKNRINRFFDKYEKEGNDNTIINNTF